jgi:hypothetical protein
LGKSSLVAALSQKGYDLLCDDITVLNPLSDETLAYPGYPSIKLWNDVVNHLKLKANSNDRIRPNLNKFRIYINESDCQDTFPLNSIFILNKKNSPGFELNELKGIQKLKAIKNNVYRSQFLNGLQKSETHFKLLTSLVNKVPVYQILRPASPLMLSELSDFVEEKMHEINTL